jgi:hypothetical protein
MMSKNPGIVAILFFLALAATGAAQTGNSAAGQNKPSPAMPAATTPKPAQTSAPNAAAPPAPSAVSPTASGAATPERANPAAPANCQGGACDAQPPHITIATPAPAPAPWPMQDRIAWVAQILLVLIAYVGIMLALSTLRKIERQTRYGEAAAQSAAESAKAALLLAQAQERAERPWILISPEPVPGMQDSFTVVAKNRGRNPARIVSIVDEIATARDAAQLPPAPAFKTEPRAPNSPIILLPGESAGIKSFRRADVKTVCETAEDLRRVEEWEAKIYLYGRVAYTDLRSADESEVHETSWFCWYIHGRQKSGLVMAGPPEYNRHT